MRGSRGGGWGRGEGKEGRGGMVERFAGLSSVQTAALTLTVSNEHASAAHKGTLKVCFVREWKYFSLSVGDLVSFNFQLLSYCMYVRMYIAYVYLTCIRLCVYRTVSVQCTTV